jgi:hypothetical protein
VQLPDGNFVELGEDFPQDDFRNFLLAARKAA